MMTSKTDKFWQIFFPQDCPFCGGSMPQNALCCDDCADKLPHLTRPILLKENDPIDGIAVPFSYEGVAKAAVLRLKNRDRPESARVLARWMAVAVRHAGFEDIDCILPIPPHKKRLYQNGYGAAPELAKYLGRALSVPVLGKGLRMTRKTAQQHTVSFEERMKNLVGAYRASLDLSGKRVLLCDDVTTTGTTFREAARACRAAGAEKVYAVALNAVPKPKQDRN